jgi:hypothetical protein
MTVAARTYDPIRFHRGTRGFAAFLTALNGFVVLGAALFIVPALDLASLVATWAVIIGTTAGIAHFVAVVGLIRGRRWAASLVGYLATGGIALAVFGALLAATRVEIFGADRPTSLGVFLWLIATWLIAARFAIKPFTFEPQAHRVMTPVAKPAPDARPLTGVRKRTVARPLASPA